LVLVAGGFRPPVAVIPRVMPILTPVRAAWTSTWSGRG